jgi:hypothetical protein
MNRHQALVLRSVRWLYQRFCPHETLCPATKFNKLTVVQALRGVTQFCPSVRATHSRFPTSDALIVSGYSVGTCTMNHVMKTCEWPNEFPFLALYEGVSKSFRTELITKYTLTFGITRWEATQRVMAAKLTRLTHLVTESCTIFSSRSSWPARKLLDTLSYNTDIEAGVGVAQSV